MSSSSRTDTSVTACQSASGAAPVPTILIQGAMRYAPNIDAVRFFVQILPEVSRPPG